MIEESQIVCHIKKRIAQVIMDDYVEKILIGCRQAGTFLFWQAAVWSSKQYKDISYFILWYNEKYVLHISNNPL
ncbi:MAG: hypothetical protein ACLUPV_03625 [Bilophila wadsworthia]